MPVQVVENWALIRGKIVSIKPHDQLDQYTSATVAVTEVNPKGDYPNLFAWAPGKEIAVNIPKAKTDELSLATGDLISAQVRKAGPTSAFVDADSLTKSG
jgi:hypothetical protein